MLTTNLVRALLDTAGKLRELLPRATGHLADAYEGQRMGADALRAASRGIVDSDNLMTGKSAFGPDSSGGTPWNGHGNASIVSRADPSFHPDYPVSVRNLPPREELTFEYIPAGVGENYLLSHREIPVGIYKPRDAIRSRNEIAGWNGSRILHAGGVPYARMWRGKHGPGVLIEYVPNKGPAEGLTTDEGKHIAVFDYVMGSFDGHRADVVERESAGMARLDNEYLAPEPMANKRNHILSEFVVANLGKSHKRSVSLCLKSTSSKRSSTAGPRFR